ncbi:transposase [Bradyrhizobium sp. SRL28]|uniref:transposase n=1 Tax=Bradyrhizobium sp. SRL28 TaxID=2836178 RepID=UPI001BDEB39D|nr:transposase [Bradyrhizobium sp. SRL28]
MSLITILAARRGIDGYWRSLATRVGPLELMVPQDWTGRFSTELFERYQRLEDARRDVSGAVRASRLDAYDQGDDEELCGHGYSASSIGTIAEMLDEALRVSAERPWKRWFLVSCSTPATRGSPRPG